MKKPFSIACHSGVIGPFGRNNGGFGQMTAELNATAAHRSSDDERSERLWWIAGLSAAFLFLVLAGLVNGVAYWKLSEEQQLLALSAANASAPATHGLLPYPASFSDRYIPPPVVRSSRHR